MAISGHYNKGPYGGSGRGNFRDAPGQKSGDVRINRRIRIAEVRLIGQEGEQLGVLPTYEALRIAEADGLDLVEVSPMARPPVCKIMDYGKFKYQQKRKAAEARKKQQQVEIKEVKFRPKTEVHDFEVKVKRLRKFISQKNKAKATVVFRGREIVHRDIGTSIMKRVIEALTDIAVVEFPPRMEGKFLVMILAPQKSV